MSARQRAAVLFIFVLSRLCLLFVLYSVTHGNEISNDTSMHLDMVRAPLSVITGNDPRTQQYAPALPVFEAVAVTPFLTIFPDFLAIRLGFALYETVGLALCLWIMALLRFEIKRQLIAASALIVAPMGWMTSTVMAQDEIIASVFLLLAVGLFLSGRPKLALLVCGIGIAGAKIFLVLPLLCFLAAVPRAQRVACAAAGFAPVVLSYGLVDAYRYHAGKVLPLIGTQPHIYAGTNLVILLNHYMGFEIGAHQLPLQVIALGGSLLVIWFAKRRGGDFILRLIACCLLTFFSLFYHMQPEYFVMVVPLLIVSACTIPDAVAIAIVAVMPWLIKFAQNAMFHVAVSDDTAAGKSVALNIYRAMFGIDPERLWVGSIILFSAATILIAARMARQLSTAKP